MRPSKDLTWLRMADILSMRSTCKRNQVGCVVLNKRGHVLSTGYNGVAAGWQHCIDVACPGAGMSSGEGLDICQAIHAEQNALLQCPDVHEIEVLYCTHSPCMHCIKLLLNTSCERVVFRKFYDQDALDLWSRMGRIWEQIT